MKSGVLLRAAAAIAVAVCTLPLAAPPAAAQPLVFVVPYPPGGSTDVIPRLLTPIVSRTAKTSVIVENRPGANGSIGAAHVARAAPDGHTVLMAPTGVLSINQWLYKQLPYKPERDLAPITNAATTPNMVVVSSSLPINSLQELIAMAKAKPDTLTFASSGNGSTSHLCGELLRKMAGIDIVHVPYKGPGPAMQDVLSGRVTMMCEAFSNAMVHVRSGRLRALVLAAQQPHPQAPSIPTSAQVGLPGFEASAWFGFVAPSGTPAADIERVNRHLVDALRTPEVLKRFDDLGLTVVADSPAEFGRFIATESDKWRKIIELSGATAD